MTDVVSRRIECKMVAMLSCRRDDFDIPSDVTYLNCAFMGPLSRGVVEAGRRGLESKIQPWTIKPKDFFDPVDEARDLFAQVIDADADGVALLPSVSYGIAIAASNLPFPRGGRVIVLAEEFPSNVYAWRELAARNDGEVVTVAKSADRDWTRPLLGAIDERAAIVALPHCHWTDGGIVDLERVAARVREAHAALVIDGTQSIGAMPFDVATIKPDFLVTASYKWLLGPYSSAFMWVAPEHRDGLPLEYSWITRAHSDDFPHLIEYVDAYRPGARRYDVGETSNFALIPAVTAALEQTLRWGVASIAEYTGRLTGRLVDAASEIGLSVAPDHLRSPHLIGVHLGGAEAGAVESAMAAAQVHVSVRGDAMRVAPHVYNDESDIDRLVAVLRAGL